jgi:hypothetical protein
MNPPSTSRKSARINHFFTVALFILLALVPDLVRADDLAPTRFWGGIEIGAGSIRIDRPGGSFSDSTTYLAFKGAYMFSEQLYVGVELGGHLLEAGNLSDEAEGAGLSQVLLIIQYYPYPQPAWQGWYAKGGAGYVSFWDNSPDAQREEGWGMTVALGYDWWVEGYGATGPLLSYGYGEEGDSKHSAIALAMSWSYP